LELPVVLGQLVAALVPRLAVDGSDGPTFWPILGLLQTLRAIDTTTSRSSTRALTEAIDPVAYDVLALLPNAPASETERIVAAERLAEHFRRPVHRARWRRVQAALRQLVELHAVAEAGPATTEGSELGRLVRTRLFEAVTAVATLPVTAKREIAKGIQAELNRLVTQDLLGPGWRRMGRELPVEAFEEQEQLEQRPVDQAELRLTAAAAVARARLTPRESEVLGLRLVEYTFPEIGMALGISAKTAHTLWIRAKRKTVRGGQ
jgi:DNA-binding CsgD family transcriptional regulator